MSWCSVFTILQIIKHTVNHITQARYNEIEADRLHAHYGGSNIPIQINHINQWRIYKGRAGSASPLGDGLPQTP